jgi:hypothetical protein
MEATVGTHLPDGATVAYEEVSPATFDGDRPGHGPGHTHDHDHSHSHDRDGPGDGSDHKGGSV